MKPQKAARVALLAVLLSLAPTGQALAQAVPVPDFCFFLDVSGGVASIDNNTAPMQSLDLAGQPENPRRRYKLGFGTSVGSTGVDGCATNTFVGPGFGEILEGQLSATLPIGTPPSAAWVVLDFNNDGIGTFDAATQTWTPGADDYVFQPDEVSVDGTLLSAGGAANLPVGGSSGSAIPAILLPEPGLAALLGVGALGLAGLGARRHR